MNMLDCALAGLGSILNKDIHASVPIARRRCSPNSRISGRLLLTPVCKRSGWTTSWYSSELRIAMDPHVAGGTKLLGIITMIIS